MSPAKIRVLLESGLALHNGGRRTEAEALYRQVLAAAPRNFDALHLLGLAALQEGRFTAAVELLRRALKVSPTAAVCELRLGAALLASGSAAAAETHLRRATERAPSLPEAWFHLGVALRARGAAVPAREALEQALRLRADYPEALEHLGALVSRAEGYAAAVPILRRRAELQPAHPEALANLGVALAQTPEREQALAVLDRALELDPSNAQALTGRALVLQESYRVEEAVACYGRAIAANPANFEARSGRLFSLHYLDGVSRAELREEHAAFAASLPPAPPFAGRNDPDPSRRVRVGFLSPDLRSHSVAYFLEPILRHLDPRQFETFLYHDHPRLDAVSARLRAGAAGWRHVAPLSAAGLEAVIRADAPDVLVDLAGHTGLNRLPLFARRLAPVQVTYLGYPDTTGLREMDYRLVDAITDPVGEAEESSSESLCRFAPTAWSYGPPEAAPAPAPAPSASAGHVTFGCFNNFSKVSDSTLRNWAQLLGVVPGSCSNGTACPARGSPRGSGPAWRPSASILTASNWPAARPTWHPTSVSMPGSTSPSTRARITARRPLARRSGWACPWSRCAATGIARGWGPACSPRPGTRIGSPARPRTMSASPPDWRPMAPAGPRGAPGSGTTWPAGRSSTTQGRPRASGPLSGASGRNGAASGRRRLLRFRSFGTGASR
jgi:predicted O-linked N-acetylglucosamine transferase (SPINDLY family)